MRELLIYLKLGLTPILTALLLMLNACSSTTTLSLSLIFKKSCIMLPSCHLP